MQELEKHFDDPPLLPSSSELREEVEEVCKQASGLHLLTVVVLLPPTGGISFTLFHLSHVRWLTA